MISSYLKKPANNKNDELQRVISMFVKESALKNDINMHMQSDNTKIPQFNQSAEVPEKQELMNLTLTR